MIDQYIHTNAKGVTYYLREMTVRLRSGREQSIYYFTKTPDSERGTPAALPADREIRENPSNGFLAVVKKHRK